MAAESKDFDLEDWARCKNVKFIHLLKLLSLILRLLLCMCILGSGFMLMFMTPDVLARRVDWGGRLTAGSCFFLTGEEYGVEVSLDLLSASAGTQTFCGMAPEDVSTTFQQNMLLALVQRQLIFVGLRGALFS